MFRKVADHLTYANVMATLAVFIAIGGGAYAAGLAKNSVGSKQIKDGAVKSRDVKDNSLTGKDIKVASLGLLSSGQVVIRQNSKTVPSLPVDSAESVIAHCDAGERAISGGAYTSDSTAAVSESWPFANDGIATGWVVQYFNGGTYNLTNVQILAYVFCVPG